MIIPSRDLNICPLETVSFSCVINRQQNDSLRWTIDFMHQSVEQIVITFIGSQVELGMSKTRTNNIQQSVTFMLISTSPYINSSMSMMIKENPEFSQVSIECSNGLASLSKLYMSIIHIITQGSILLYQNYYSIVLVINLLPRHTYCGMGCCNNKSRFNLNIWLSS